MLPTTTETSTARSRIAVEITNARLRSRASSPGARRARLRMARRAAASMSASTTCSRHDLPEDLGQRRTRGGDARTEPTSTARRTRACSGLGRRRLEDARPPSSSTTRPRRSSRIQPASPETTSSHAAAPCSSRSASRVAGGADAAVGDDHEVVAEPLDQLELVAGEQHGRPARRPPAARRRRRLDGDRVEAGERLVEDEDPGRVHQRGRDLRALLVAERETLDVVARPLAEAEPLEQGGGGALGVTARAARADARSRRSARRAASSGRGPAPRACSRTAGGRRG